MLKVTRKLSDKPRPRFLRAHLLSGLWALFILVICILPGDTFPDIDFWEIEWEDKVIHAGVFALLGALMVWGEWRRTGKKNPRPAVKVLIVIFCLLFGLSTEIIQSQFIPTRYGSIGDVIADFAGALAGTLLAPYALRIIDKF